MKNLPYRQKSLWETLNNHHGWGWPDVFHFRSSVFLTVFPVVFTSTLLSTILCVLYLIYDVDVTLPASLVGTITVVVGLLLAFRTNHAYDRYYEGRKLFSTMCTHVRNAARLTWVGVEERNREDHEDKINAIKLLLAFVIATKHHLRTEFGTDYEDLKDLLPDGLQKTKFGGNAGQDVDSEEHEEQHRQDYSEDSIVTVIADNENTALLQNCESPKKYVNNNYDNLYTKKLPNFRASGSSAISENRLMDWGGKINPTMSLPLEITYYLGLYFNRKQFDAINNILSSLIEILGCLERIGNTPIPNAYRYHLKQAVSIYVWMLPFTMIESLGWLTIPVIAVISFVLFGVEAIGAEIENPFGYDANDLPLDEYCKPKEISCK
ncbi:7761_t:CDS:2 [Diversispora eburnea]|uniref:7761_t:CDS:1 n=1 Tax=Diversispora eburnea TaxID=1213867 RepID=A0A9N8YLT6_9GLOM|nr:7761_t:CDS:2 [Diversispora eburnea]